MAGALGGIVVLSTSAVALLFQLVPGLQPQGPPPRLSADIVEVTIDPNVRLRAFIGRLGVPSVAEELRVQVRADEPNEVKARAKVQLFLQFAGAIVYVKVRTEGIERALESPGAFLYDARTGTRITQPFDSIFAFATRDTRFRPRAGSDQAVAAIFTVCHPDPSRSAFLRIELRDDQDRLVDVENSEVFRCSIL